MDVANGIIRDPLLRDIISDRLKAPALDITKSDHIISLAGLS